MMPRKFRKKIHDLNLKGREIKVFHHKKEQQPEKVKEISQDVQTDGSTNYKKERHFSIPWKLKYWEIESEHAKQQNKKLPDKVRGVVLWGAGGAMAPPDFGRLVNPISTRRGRLC